MRYRYPKGHPKGGRFLSEDQVAILREAGMRPVEVGTFKSPEKKKKKKKKRLRKAKPVRIKKPKPAKPKPAKPKKPAKPRKQPKQPTEERIEHPGAGYGKPGYLAPPEGFVTLGAAERERVRRELETVLTILKQALSSKEVQTDLGLRDPLGTSSFVHENRDGSIDAEFRVAPIPKSVTVAEVLLIIEGFLMANPITNTFGTAGVIFHTPDGADYRRYRGGKSIVNAYYHEMIPKKIPQMLLMMRYIDQQMRDHEREHPERLFLRFHWNEQHQRPAANGRPPVKKPSKKRK